MLVRIVKLTFREENISRFEEIFEQTKKYIRNFDGCSFLELYRDQNDPNIFFTYSHWSTEKDLEAYRNSDFFKKVWSQTRQLFSEKAEAWSLSKVDSLS